MADGRVGLNSGIRYSAYNAGPESVEWCREHFGEPHLLRGRYTVFQWTIQFRNRKDRDWYLLRWL